MKKTISALPEGVWNVLTREEHLHRWWGPHVHLDPRPGGTFRETWQNQDGREVVTRGTVVSWIPGKEMSLTWADDDWDIETTVFFRLKPEAAQTLLELTHCGWDPFPEDRRASLMAAHREGWTGHLHHLKQYAESG